MPIGWWVGYKITDEDTWARIKSGQYSMFSIEGKGKRIAVGKSKRPAPTFFEILRRDMAHGITPENWDVRVEIKKYNPYHGKDGRFTTAPGGRKTTVSGRNKYKPIKLEKDEYAKVCSEISTNYSKYKSHKMCVHKTVYKDDFYDYSFENRGFGEYEFFAKRRNRA